MGLRIQNNIAAMNAHRQLTISDGMMSKSLQRLSSGFRINKAADDAAGLAVSQNFRADLASFSVAQRNTTEATALLQVAEGASDQIGNMLTRLKELATQAASANAADNLSTINNEASSVLDEIDRIAGSTKYGDSNLIDGSYGITANTTGADAATANGFESMSGMKAGYTYRIDVNDATPVSDSDLDSIAITAFNASGTTVGTQTVYGITGPSGADTKSIKFESLGVSLKVNSSIATSGTQIDGTATTSDVVAGTNGNSTFQVGAQNAENNRLTIGIDGMDTTDLGINGISLSSGTGAQEALSSIDSAIDTLASSRAEIGAYQNRLSFASANVSTTIENVQAAESVIRDVDMAAEMTNFTKSQILLQAGTAMLAQANTAPQSVLSLIG